MLFASIVKSVRKAVRALISLVRAAAAGCRPPIFAAMVLLWVSAQAADAAEALASVPAAATPLIAGGEFGDRFGFHGQSTWVWQAKPAFKSPYSGDNSLTADRATSYSFSTTLDLGMRLWRGAE